MHVSYVSRFAVVDSAARPGFTPPRLLDSKCAFSCHSCSIVYNVVLDHFHVTFDHDGLLCPRRN